MIQIQLQRYDPLATLESSGAGGRPDSFQPFGQDGLTFGDIIDVINPLQHIPLLGGLYRKLTGDTIDPAIRVAGGALFGGPIGAAVSAVTVAIAELRKDSTANFDAPDRQVADHFASPADGTVAPARLVATSGAGFAESLHEREAANVAESHKLRANTGPEIRRGGWMVIQAYGVAHPGSVADRLSERDKIVDLAV